MNLSNDFEVRKETLRALGGNPDGLANIYEVDLEILKLIGSGEQGIPDAPIDGVQYARQNGEWTPVESGVDWNTIKQKLAEDGVESIKFIMAGEEVIVTASEVKTLINQTVLPDAPSDGKTYGRNNGAWTQVEEGITDAPSDGKQYARKNAEWTVVEEGLTDAPTDGTQYARQNGAWTPVQIPTVEKYVTITADESNSGETIIHPNIEGSLPNLNLQYRINNGKWMDFIVGTTDDIKIGAGDVLQFKGDNKEGVSTYSNHLNFGVSGNPVALSGNIMSLIDGVGETTVIPNEYCFHALFRNSAIKTVSSDFLHATTLTSSCYRDLFSGCQNLTQSPELPATTLANECYNGMFYNCASLTNAPELPAKVLLDGCYGYMFTYCYSLNYVKCLATEGTINGDGTVPSALDHWLEGVASTGTIEKISGVSYEAGGNGIPEGWTVKEIYEYVEAPMDGNQYARQDGTWTVVEPGISDAPSNGKQYARQDGSWTPVKEGITDSPSDGNQYARQDGAWAVVEKGITDSPIDGVQYARQNGAWTPVEKGIDWNTIKQKLAEDGVESIKFIMAGEEIILTASEVKTLINQTVLPDAPSDGKQYARQNGEWTHVEPGISDAPSDGTQYARQNGAWTPVEEGLTDAPSDGKTYGRNNGAWTQVEEGITDSPSDGKQYARQDGAWTVVESVEPGISDAPTDGQQYARQNGNWTPVEEGLTDAPSDGTQYARQNGAWTPVESVEPGISDAPSDGVQYARQNGAWVEAEPSKVKTTKDTTLQFWSGTQQEYDAIVTKDANTLYIIK